MSDYYTCRRMRKNKKTKQRFRCNEPLYTDDEMCYGYCESCLDSMADAYNEMKEWEYYHN